MIINNKLKTEGYISFGKEEDVIISVINEWCQFFPRKGVTYNWVKFNLVHCDYEDNICMSGREITIVLLGFGFRVRWTHKTEKGEKNIRDMKNSLDDVLNNSFYGWASKMNIENFRNKKENHLAVFRTRKIAREYNCTKIKKLFIQ